MHPFDAPSPRATAQSSSHLRPSLTGVLFLAGVLAVVVFLALPLVSILWRTAGTLSDIDSDTRRTTWQALRLTIVTTAASLAFILVLGTPVAFLLARYRFRGSRVLEALIDVPVVLPPSVAGIGLLMAFGRRGLLGGYLYDAGITISFTTLAVVLAQCFVAAPFYIRSARAGFASYQRDVEEAASVDGASRLQITRDVTLPLAFPALSAGAVLAWTRAVGEFGATILFAGNFVGKTQTMPLAIYANYISGDLPTALAISSVLLVISFAVLVLVRVFVRMPSESGPS
ncbi:MAG: molybdate ABC transporter permease subunit [Thermomicrobiales bacterium]|jgi:molybdate transport system permease protein|nr:molybdate ABC transporter permease subunit [Thermomicrobiales bacterium]